MPSFRLETGQLKNKNIAAYRENPAYKRQYADSYLHHFDAFIHHFGLGSKRSKSVPPWDSHHGRAFSQRFLREQRLSRSHKY